MGFNVVLEDENGNEIASVADPIGLPLTRAIPQQGDPRFPWSSTIDPYGDTTFNRIQGDSLRKEWAILIENAADEQTETVLRKVDDLLQRCVHGIHLYVKFYGD